MSLQDTFKSLKYAVRPGVLVKYLGLLALMLSGLALVPLVVSLCFGEYELSERYAVVIVLLILLGLPSLRREHSADIQNNESLVITGLAFFITPLLMSYPIMGSGLGFMDAWFEAVSAVTTTGLSTVSNLEQMPRTFLFARAWMQWYGGLGFVVLSVAILMNHRIALRRLLNPNEEITVTTTRVYARRTLAAYIVLTLLGLAALTLLLGDAFTALSFTLSAVSTGGFAPISSSLADLPWQAQYGVTTLSLCGAIPFIFYYRLTHGGWREVFGDIEVRTFLGITLLLVLLLSLSLAVHTDLSWREVFHQGGLLGVSAQSTTGFSSLDLKRLDNFSLGLIILAMVIGGNVGSTAGGFKILRLLILWQMIRLVIQRTAMPPHAVTQPHLDNRRIRGDDIERALLLILLFIIVISTSWLIFLAYGYAPLPALFEVTSAAGTVGLSSGLTSHDMPPILKGVLGLNMLFGRVEMVAMLVLFYPGTWWGKRKQ